MGDCEYCGQPAGLMRSIHKECAGRRDQALKDIDQSFRNMMTVERPPTPATFRAIVEKLAADAHLDQSGLHQRVLTGLSLSLDTALADFELTAEETDRFQSVMTAFDLEADSLDKAGIRDKLVKALVLRDLSEGKVSTRLSVNFALPIAMKRGEQIQWLFNNVGLREQHTSYSYEGGSRGVSIRIMKGVSYRVGAYKGHRVENTSMIHVGDGDLAVTNNAIYFICPPKTKKTALSAIVSVDAYDDGIIVTASRGKPKIYMLDDPHFAANLILKAGAL